MSNKMIFGKNKRLLILIVVVIFISAISAYIIKKSETVEKYVLRNCENATEILCYDISDDYVVCFYLEDNAAISCVLLKNTQLGYKTIRTSGKLGLAFPGPLCSFFNEGDESLWLDWGIISDDSIKSVCSDYGMMKIIECKPYSYRIYWMIGSGEEPKNHTEIK